MNEKFYETKIVIVTRGANTSIKMVVLSLKYASINLVQNALTSDTKYLTIFIFFIMKVGEARASLVSLSVRP